jgi:hypothetical protein
MIAVRCEHEVICRQRCASADSRGLLAYRDMRVAADPLRRIFGKPHDRFFEAADAQHRAPQLDSMLHSRNSVR